MFIAANNLIQGRHATRIAMALLLLALLALVASAGSAASIERSFVTKIMDRGEPARGVYDVELRLYDAERDGTLVDTWQEPGRSVVAGDLEVALPVAFAGRADLWLEIAIAEAGSGDFESLPQRQSLRGGGGTCNVGTLVIDDRLGIGVAVPKGPIHIVSDTEPPIGLPPAEFGLMIGSEDVGVPSAWLQSYGKVLQINPRGNFVNVGPEAIPLATLHVNGSLRSNSLIVDGPVTATGYIQPGGGENLRIIRGAIGSDGSTPIGSGFTATRTSPGRYTVTFDTPFPSLPTVVTSAIPGNRLATPDAITNSLVAVGVWDQVGPPGAIDSAFHFIAIGPSQ